MSPERIAASRSRSAWEALGIPAGLPAELPALLGLLELPDELPAGPVPRSDRRFRPRGENGGTYRRYVRSGSRFVTATATATATATHASPQATHAPGTESELSGHCPA